MIDGFNKYQPVIDPYLIYSFICPRCRHIKAPIRNVSDTEMICPVCGTHLRKWDIHDRMSKRPKHFVMSRIMKIPIIGGK